MAEGGTEIDPYDFYQEFECLRELYNLVVISNTFSFDKVHNQDTGKIERRITDFNKNILTSVNKYEFVNETNKDLLAPMQRRNIIIMGDQLHDLELIDPKSYENVLSIGYINDLKRQDILQFMDHFDIVISQDGPLLPFNAVMDMIAMGGRVDAQHKPSIADITEKYSQYPELEELCATIKSTAN